MESRLTWKGFNQSDPGYGDVYRADHQKRLGDWIADGSVKAKLAITDGIDGAPEAFAGMLQGKNFGHAVVKIKDE
jgi:NADPH-dependent curcumin reductase CurA